MGIFINANNMIDCGEPDDLILIIHESLCGIFENGLVGVSGVRDRSDEMKDESSDNAKKDSKAKEFFKKARQYIMDLINYVKKMIMGFIKTLMHRFYETDAFIKEYRDDIMEKDGSLFRYKMYGYDLDNGDTYAYRLLNDVKEIFPTIGEDFEKALTMSDITNIKKETYTKKISSVLTIEEIDDLIRHNYKISRHNDDNELKYAERKTLSRSDKMTMFKYVDSFKHMMDFLNKEKSKIDTMTKIVDSSISEYEKEYNNNEDDMQLQKIKHSVPIYKVFIGLNLSVISYMVKAHTRYFNQTIKVFHEFVTYKP